MSEKLERLGLTPRMLAFSLTWCIFNTVVFGAALSIKNSDAYIPTFLLFAVEAFVAKALSSKYRFTPQEWAVFFAIAGSGLLTTPVMDGGNFRGNQAGMSKAFFKSFEEAYAVNFERWNTWKQPMPDIWVVKDSTAVQGYLYGGPVPWGLYAPVIAWNIVNMASMYLAFHFLSIVFLRPWIDQEKLTFPWQRPWIETVKATHNMESIFATGTSFWNPLKNKWFWTGFFITAILMLPDLSEIYFGVNWFTGITIGGRTFVRHRYQRFILMPISAYLNPIWMQDFLPGSFEISSGGWMVAGYTLMPTDILYTAVLYKFISGTLLYGINYYSGSTVGGAEGLTSGLIKYRLMFVGNYSTLGAIFVAIPLVMFWRARTHIVHTFKAFIAGSPREEGEPHSWRIVWLGFFGLFIVWGVTMLVAGAVWYSLIASLVTYSLFFVFQARWISETGGASFANGHNEPGGYPAYNMLALQAGGTYGNNTATIVTANYDASWFGWFGYNPAIGPSMVGFKFARELNTRTKDISYAIIIATVIGFIVAVPTAIWTYYNWGASVIYTRVLELGGIAKSDWLRADVMAIKGQTWFQFFGYPQDFWGWWTAGLVFVFVLEYLRTRWAWIVPFTNPMGIAIGASLWGGDMIVAVLIKWLSLKFLGGKGYERIIVALMSGIILGYAFWFMFGIMSTTIWRI